MYIDHYSSSDYLSDLSKTYMLMTDPLNKRLSHEQISNIQSLLSISITDLIDTPTSEMTGEILKIKGSMRKLLHSYTDILKGLRRVSSNSLRFR